VFVIQFTEMFLLTFVLIKRFIVNLIHLSDLLLASLPTYRPTHFDGLNPTLFNKWLKCLDSEQNKPPPKKKDGGHTMTSAVNLINIILIAHIE
jgi:hypothetical protein